MERGLLKIRNEALPKSPKNCEEIIAAFNIPYVIENYGLTIRDGDESANTPPRSMYYKHTFESNEHSFCVFASDDIVKAINEHVTQDTRRYYMDATFKICPLGIFKQLLIMYVLFMGQIVPFCFVLMDRKTELAYIDIYKYIHENIINLNGKAFMTDYEKAMRNGLKKLFPNAEMNACWFHFTQAVKKHVKKFPALVKLIQSNSEAAKIYYKLQAIPLLPKDQIISAFFMLKSQAVETHRTKFNKFLQYYEQQWLKTVRISLLKKLYHCFDLFTYNLMKFAIF